MKVESDRLATALKTMTRLAQPQVVTLNLRGSTLVLKGAGETSACSYKIDVNPSGDDEKLTVTVDVGLLTSVIEKRKELEMKVDSNVLLISSKGFTAELVGIDGQPVVVVPKEVAEAEDGIVISNKLMKHLLKVLPKIELRPLLSTYSDVPIGVRSTSEGTFVACFDFVQTAYTNIPEATGEFEFLLPSVSLFNTLTRELAGQKYKMVITDTTLYAFNSEVQVALSLPQQDGEQPTLDDVAGLVKNLEDVKYTTLLLDAEAIKAFLGNSRSIYDKDSVFTVSVKNNKVRIDLKATVGNTSMTTKLLKEAKDIDFKCDLNFFNSIVQKSSGKKLRLRVTPELIKISEDEVDHVLSLI